MRRETFTVLSLNLGLLRFLWHEPVPQVELRLQRFAKFVSECYAIDIDVLCFQEVWERRQYEILREAFRRTHPESVAHYFGSGDAWVQGGLCIFSKQDLIPSPTRVNRMVFDGYPAYHERIARKGAIAAHVFTPLGLTAIVNTHLVSGGPFFKAGGSLMTKMRDRQLGAITRFTDDLRADSRFIVGDLNTGPLLTPENYGSMVARGYVDAWTEASSIDQRLSVTWDRQNPLNAGDSNPISDRIDHIFLPRRELSRVRVKHCAVALDELAVFLPDGTRAPYSDHYGLLATFEPR